MWADVGRYGEIAHLLEMVDLETKPSELGLDRWTAAGGLAVERRRRLVVRGDDVRQVYRVRTRPAEHHRTQALALLLLDSANSRAQPTEVRRDLVLLKGRGSRGRRAQAVLERERCILRGRNRARARVSAHSTKKLGDSIGDEGGTPAVHTYLHEHDLHAQELLAKCRIFGRQVLCHERMAVGGHAVATPHRRRERG